MKWVKAVSVLSPDKIAWFSLASVDPLLVDHTLTRFLAQWWQDGDTGQVITGLNCGFQGIVIGKVDDIGPHKGLCGMLHWYSSHEILITPSTLQQADPDNLRDKGKSEAQEPEVPSGDGNIDEGSDLIQVSVSMDKALIIPPSTLQFSRERGYDVTIGNHVRVFCLMMVHCFCIKLENHSLRDVECQVGREVWIISGPKKGYRGMLRSVSRTYCNVTIKSSIMQLKNTAVVTDTTPPMLTVDPSAEPGPSTLACNPWVSHPDNITPQPLNELAQANVDYRCVPWLFNNNFCDYANWHVCLRVGMSYNCGSLLNRTWAWLSTSWSCVSHCDLQYMCDLTPANLRSAGQYCLVLHGKLVGQIHQVKKCQVKKDPKGVELEDGTKLPLGDVCQVISAN
ncbi:hypothetical protein EDC04DRAFT_2599941 [Pisolithus marmoratus]|nr:hypothetical protein EDC04DRAFT_2599941 [Pisolithus marmoratus]